MKKWIFLLLSGGLLWYLLVPQWQSLDKMAERRFKALNLQGHELLVGVSWPFAINQDGMADGLQLAMEEINAGNLTGGPPIRLVFRDPGFDRAKNRAIALEFADTPEMSAVLGYYEDSAAITASVLFESSRLLHLMIGANSNAMTQRGYKYIARTVLCNGLIAEALAKKSVALGYKNFALIWEEDAFGMDLAYQYHVAMDGMAKELLYQVSYPLDRADFRLCVNELKEVDADVIFFAGLEPQAGDFIRTARAVGLKTPILGAFSDTPEMRRRAGPALEGAMFFDFYNVNSPTPENQAFVRNFQARFHRMPDAMAAQGYDALRILAKGARFTNSRNPLDLSYAIRFMDSWEGANGRYQFDGHGELKDKPLYIKVYKNGVPETLQAPPPPATAP